MRLFHRRRQGTAPPAVATAETTNRDVENPAPGPAGENDMESVLAQLRETGLHGEPAASHLAAAERFDLPPPEELDALRIMVLERNALPFHQGIVVGMFADVMLGWRSLDAALAEGRARATPENVPLRYCEAVEFVAVSFSGDGRAREAVFLSLLLLEATAAAHGVGSRPWICGARAFLQAANRVRETIDPALLPTLPAAATVAQELEGAARAAGDRSVLSSSLSVLGQYWWMTSLGDDDPDVPGLGRAESALSEAAELRDGAERGRTLATLAQVQLALHQADALAAEVPEATAKQSIDLVDRGQRPRQWLAARRVLHELDAETSTVENLTIEDLERIRGTLGDQVAADCLAEEVRALTRSGRITAASEMLRDAYPRVRFDRVDQPTRQLLLAAAAHVLDDGAVPCRALTSSEAARMLATTATLPASSQMLARLHLGLHSKDHKPVIDWLIANGTPRLHDLQHGYERDGALFALAEVHEARAKDPDVSPMLAFRAALLAASLVAQAGLFEVAIGTLSVALSRAREWAASCTTSAQAGSTDSVRRVDAEGFIDACLRETAMLDALLGDACREWTLEVGRILSAPVRLGAASSPYLTIAHSAAFKGSVTARLLADPGPAPVQPAIEQTLRELAAIRDDEQEYAQPVVPADAAEVRVCAWLHGHEQTSGSTASEQRANLERRFDERHMSAVVAQRQPWNRGLAELGFEHLERRFGPSGPGGPTTAFLDLYIGRDETGAYCVYLSLLFRGEWRRYGVRLPYEELAVLPDPADPSARLLIDGIGLFGAKLRELIQEPAAHRPISRAGADALDAASDQLLGGLRSELSALFDAGCDRLVICPHGPLAFIPFHLLPAGNKLLAEHATITVLPALGTALSPPPPRLRNRGVSLGIAASPNGGIASGLPAEPRIWDQARQLAELVPGATLLPAGEATPEATLALLGHSRFVHIASHGAALGSAPSFHRLFLDQSGADSGVLWAYRVLATDLRGVELITLCACETAVGRVDPAGNLRGLTTAFLAAGAEAVIAALWPVRADSALYFFSDIYARISEDITPEPAYRAAQAATRRVFPRFADWGAFAYMGR